VAGGLVDDEPLAAAAAVEVGLDGTGRPAPDADDEDQERVDDTAEDGTLLPAEICQEDMAELLAGHLLDLVEEDDQRQLVLNLAPVRLLSSAMLARLMRLRRQVQELGGRLAVYKASPELGEILDLLGLPQLLSFSGEEDEALRGPDPEGSLP
jgi:anti-anti-sigma factor